MYPIVLVERISTRVTEFVYVFDVADDLRIQKTHLLSITYTCCLPSLFTVRGSVLQAFISQSFIAVETLVQVAEYCLVLGESANQFRLYRVVFLRTKWSFWYRTDPLWLSIVRRAPWKSAGGLGSKHCKDNKCTGSRDEESVFMD